MNHCRYHIRERKASCNGRKNNQTRLNEIDFWSHQFILWGSQSVDYGVIDITLEFLWGIIHIRGFASMNDLQSHRKPFMQCAFRLLFLFSEFLFHALDYFFGVRYTIHRHIHFVARNNHSELISFYFKLFIANASGFFSF